MIFRAERTSTLLKVLEAFNTSFLTSLLEQFYSNLYINKHHEHIIRVGDGSFDKMRLLRLATHACRQFVFLYRKLCLKYFVFVLSLQFEWAACGDSHPVCWCMETSSSRTRGSP